MFSRWKGARLHRKLISADVRYGSEADVRAVHRVGPLRATSGSHGRSGAPQLVRPMGVNSLSIQPRLLDRAAELQWRLVREVHGRADIYVDVEAIGIR